MDYSKPPCGLLMLRGVTPAHKRLSLSGFSFLRTIFIIQGAPHGFAKMGADGSRVSTFCFSIWLHIQLDVINLAMCKSSTFILNLASVSRADGILLPPLRQALTVGCYISTLPNYLRSQHKSLTWIFVQHILARL